MVRADFLTGVVLLVLGIATAWLSWEMPRLEVRRIHPLTVPGLVPGILGIAIAFCGAVLALRSTPGITDRTGWRLFGGLFVSAEAGRVAATLLLTLAYALILVGWLPFWLATALFVTVFIIVFERGFGVSPHPIWRSLATAAVQGVIVAVVVSVVFERGFLVRLP